MVVTARTLAAALLLSQAAPALAAFGPFRSRAPVVDVVVREVPAEDRWQVSYRLPTKAAGVDLVHGRGAFRRTTWAIQEDAHWVDSPAATAGVERLCFDRPRRDFAVSFASDTRRRDKDYEVNVAMGDGSRLLYTGHLVVRPLASCAPGGVEPVVDGKKLPASDKQLRHRFRFLTAPGRTVRVSARAGTGALDWSPPSGAEETYAYFGPQPAAPGERIALVVDPALPSWMRADLEPTLTKLLDRFAGETGMASPTRPLVLLSFDPHGSGRSFDGGVLGGVVQLSVSGEGWAAGDGGARIAWLVRLAHELFHLWDGSLLHPDAESEWLAEAAAEAFALRAAYGLGALDEQQVAERLVELGNGCLTELEGQSLLSAPARGAWDTWYTCGPVLLFIAGQTVERAHPGEGGLGLLVRRMFAEAHDAGGAYGTGTFLGWLDKLSGDRATVVALQGLIRRGVPRAADRFLAQQLGKAGYRVTLAAPADAHARPEVLGTLLTKGLLRCACGPAGAAPAAEPPVDDDCARLGGGTRVAKVGDVEVRRDPAAAYGRLRAAAGLRQPLRVVTDDREPLTLFCGKDTLDPSFDQLLVLLR